MTRSYEHPWAIEVLRDGWWMLYEVYPYWDRRDVEDEAKRLFKPNQYRLRSTELPNWLW